MKTRLQELPHVPPFQHLLSERLTSLGIMGAPRVPPLNPSETIVLTRLQELPHVDSIVRIVAGVERGVAMHQVLHAVVLQTALAAAVQRQ